MGKAKDQENIQQLQILEQSLSSLVSQKQGFQVQLNEVENALKEIQGKQVAYKIVGGVMIEKKREDIEEELNSKKKILEVRISSLEKQEEKLGTKKEELQKQVVEAMNSQNE